MQYDITIAIPVFDRFDYFPEALQCAIDQTTKCQVIVVDNCSPHTHFQDYVNALGLDNVRYYRNQSNLGMIENWNKCIEYTNTKWMTILHDDDLLSLQFIEKVTELITLYPQAGSFLTNYEKALHPQLIKHHYTSVGPVSRVKPFHFLFGNITGFPGVVFNKMQAAGQRFDVSIYPCSDYGFWLNLAKKQPIVFAHQVLAFYRVSPLQDLASVYKKVIDTTYTFRRDHVGYRNVFFKFFSLFELYKLDQRYRRDFQVKEKGNFLFSDINRHFSFFSIKIVDFLMSKYVYRLFKKIYGIKTGY